ncbi:MAG: DNA/pantothenate metabolism flavoprotein domain protein [Verrucomicrobia bacterium]|nr:DNA/pantothenate metabolism flavoprotein domain protein [Verrucomicrobiota bacterium]
MNCLVTAGPTYEPLDEVRRLTNFSTGRLGAALASHLRSRGHNVTLLLGEQATYPGPFGDHPIERFTTTARLLEQFQQRARSSVDAIFHAAAVSDFSFGKVLEQAASGEWMEVRSGKLTTRGGTLRAELVPTPKILPQLRSLYPDALIVGWKFEVEGGRDQAIDRALRQIKDSRSNACVVNGAAYGTGFGLLQPGRELRHIPDAAALCECLAERVSEPPFPS